MKNETSPPQKKKSHLAVDILIKERKSHKIQFAALKKLRKH